MEKEKYIIVLEDGREVDISETNVYQTKMVGDIYDYEQTINLWVTK